MNKRRYSFIHVHDLYVQPFSFISSSPEVSQRHGPRELKVCLVRMALGYRVRVQEPQIFLHGSGGQVVSSYLIQWGSSAELLQFWRKNHSGIDPPVEPSVPTDPTQVMMQLVARVFGSAGYCTISRSKASTDVRDRSKLKGIPKPDKFSGTIGAWDSWCFKFKTWIETSHKNAGKCIQEIESHIPRDHWDIFGCWFSWRSRACLSSG